jgi:hypothetical protein
MGGDSVREKHEVARALKRMSKTEQEEKPVETVDVTLTATIPKPFMVVLEGLSKIMGLPVETILLDELYSILSNYFSGEYFKAWFDWLADQEGVGELDTEALEKMMQKVRAEKF